MQIIKKFDKQVNYIFIAAFLIHLVIMCVEFGAWSVPFRGRLLQLAFGLCGIKILMTYYEKYEWVAMVVLGIVGTLSYVATKEKYVLYVTVLIFAAKSVDIKTVLKLLLYITLIATIVIAILSFCGVGGPSSLTLEFRPGTVTTRYCLGFSHPNNLHGTFWFVMTLIIVIYKDKLNWLHYSVFAVINAFLFVLTDSKAGVFVSFLMILAGVLYKYYVDIYNKKCIYVLGGVAFIAIIVLTIISLNVCAWLGYGPILTKIDSLLTGRISIAYYHARMEWWHLFYSWQREDMVIVDNGFAMLGVKLGYVGWLLYIVFGAFVMYKTAKNENGILFAVCVTSVVYAFMESSYILSFEHILCNLLYIVAMIYIGNGEEIISENSNART